MTGTQAPEQVHALVKGRVQGVGFRYFVREQAGQLALTGWVRNLADGRVELLAEGPRAGLEVMLAAVRRGPPGSAVADVSVEWKPASGEWTKFSVTRTE